MNLEEIKEVVNNNNLSPEIKKGEIINIIAKDENVILIVMKILEAERKNKSELIDDMNLLLSKSHIGLEDPKFNKDGFMQQEIIGFYQKYKDFVRHCFKKIK
jgi:hypothetical protein